MRTLHLSAVFLTLCLALCDEAAHAAVLQFGWTVDPIFAAALPAGSNVAVGSQVFVRYTFESTTPDQNPATSTGDYAGALTSFTVQFDTLAFTQQVGGATNTINVLSDAIFGFYEPVTTVDPSQSLPGFPSLRADVLFIPAVPAQLSSDAMLLTVPDPAQWADASSAILDPVGNVLLEARLETVCVGTCQPAWPSVVPSLAPIVCAVLAGSLIIAGGWAARTRRPRRA
jgi:hypothetical protein